MPARLNVGMTESEVEAVVKAKPIESGNVEAGVYRIYGSNESFNIDPSLHFEHPRGISGRQVDRNIQHPCRGWLASETWGRNY